jgi:hypothetical protein
MLRVMLIFVLLPVTALAQETATVPASVSADGVTPAAAPLAAAAAQAPNPRREARRRPSMVGYIGDSSTTTQIRIRVDSGFGINRPDRAEFFYGKCGCYRGLPPDHAAYDPKAAGPGPGILTDLSYGQLYVHAQYAPGPRAALFAELPVRWLSPKGFVAGTGSFPNATGISDLRFGGKAGLVSSPDRQLTFQLQLLAPTGDALKGLGTDHWSVEPTLLYAQRLSDRVGIEAQFGDVIPTGGSAGIPTSGSDKFSGSVLYYGIGPSFDVYTSDAVRVAPVVELVGWHVLGGFQTGGDNADASGSNIVNLKLGGRVAFAKGSSFYIGYGKALTDAVWYEDILRVEYRLTF